jgi:NAD+ synthase (glutamine-hydrolysing)
MPPEHSALEALTLGVRDYARKCGFSGAVIGLSGGIDSALVAAIAARALGPENVVTVAMPTRFSSEGSLADARELAVTAGMRLETVSIDEMFQGYIDALSPHLDALQPAGERDVTFENIQARIRGTVLMAISNRTGLLLLSTGNKSELAVGYTTLYGDMAGGLAVISDLPKTLVYRVAQEVNRQAGHAVIPESILTKAPSAELRPDQKDTDSLPAYEELDPILERYVEDGASVDEIVQEGFDRPTVERIARLVRTSEYKRRQMPPGLIVSSKAFGPGRRYPIAQGYDG